MFGIGQFFKRIQGVYAKEVVARMAVAEAISKHAGVSIPVESISFKGSTATLAGISQSARSAIYIKKQAILAAIATAGAPFTVKDIR